MTNNTEVEAVIQQYLRHLDGEGEMPSLDHLSSEDRERAQELMDSLQVARGMEPEASRPSLEQLLVDTKYFESLSPSHPVSEGVSIDELREHLASLQRGPIRVEVDELAQSAGVRSNYLIFVAGHRLRIQVRDELSGSDALRSPDAVVMASPVFGRFHDTAGVVVLVPDEDLSSVVIDPFDSEYCIETPTGKLKGPRVPRPVLPIADAILSFLDEIAPVFEAIPRLDFDSAAGPSFDAGTIARHAISVLVDNGRRARIAAKKAAWGALGEREADAIADLIIAASRGEADDATVDDRLRELAEAT